MEDLIEAIDSTILPRTISLEALYQILYLSQHSQSTCARIAHNTGIPEAVVWSHMQTYARWFVEWRRESNDIPVGSYPPDSFLMQAWW